MTGLAPVRGKRLQVETEKGEWLVHPPALSAVLSVRAGRCTEVWGGMFASICIYVCVFVCIAVFAVLIQLGCVPA